MSTRTTEFAAQITGDANGAIAALEKVKSRVVETGKATEAANQKVAVSTGVLIKESEKAAKGVAAITQALYAMEAEGSAKVLALGSAVGNFADLLGPKGKVVSGIAIVATSIVALFLQAKEKSAEATKAIEDDVKALVNAGNFAQITKRLQEIEQGTAGEGFRDGRSAIRARIEQLKEEALLAGKSRRFYQERQDAIIAERAKLSALNAEYDRYYQALTDPRNAPDAPRGLAGQPIVTTADSVGKTAADAKKVADELKKAAKAFDDAYAASLIATQAAIAEANREIDERQLKLQDALEKESSARRTNNAALQQEITARLTGAQAYEAYLVAQAQSVAVAEAEERAKTSGVTLTQEQIQKIREEIAERLRLQKIIDGLAGLENGNPFTLPTEADFSRVGKLAEDLARAASAASGIASAFGEAGERMADLLARSSVLLTNLNTIQRAGVFKDASGVERNVGALGALRGEAGGANQLQAITGVLGVLGAGVGIIRSWNASAQEAAAAAEAAAIALREMGAAARQQVRDYTLQVSGTPLERELAGLESQFRGIITALLEAGAPRTERLGRRGAVSTKPTAADVDQAIENYERLVEAAKRAAEFSARQAELEDDARLLLAQGRTAEADALRQLAADEKELEEARLAGADVAKKTAILEAEAAKREADRLREELKLSADVSARRAALSGDERGAFVTRQQSFAAQALQEAEALFAAGKISAELFAQLKGVIGDELVKAIGDFDAAAARATQQVQDGIALRTLAAEGRTEELEALRRRLAAEEELRNAADDTVRAQLEQLQLLEAAALSVTEALEAAQQAREGARTTARNRVALFDLTGQAAFSETLAGYGQAFAALFENFDLATLDGIDAAKGALRSVFEQLTDLSDDEVLARFGMTRDELVSALLDTSSGLTGLAASLGDVAAAAQRAAQEAADFAESVGLDYLRSQGRGQEADITVAKSKRDSRLQRAQSLGLGASILAQIESIYQADLAEINARYATAATDAAAAVTSTMSATRATSRPRGGSGRVQQEIGALAEVTGQTLAGLLREVAINTGRSGAIVEAILGRGVPSLAGLTFPSYAPTAAGGGTVVQFGTVNITVGSLNPMGMAPAEAATSVLQELGRQMGQLVSAEVMFLGDSRR